MKFTSWFKKLILLYKKYRFWAILVNAVVLLPLAFISWSVAYLNDRLEDLSNIVEQYMPNPNKNRPIFRKHSKSEDQPFWLSNDQD